LLTENIVEKAWLQGCIVISFKLTEWNFPGL